MKSHEQLILRFLTGFGWRQMEQVVQCVVPSTQRFGIRLHPHHRMRNPDRIFLCHSREFPDLAASFVRQEIQQRHFDNHRIPRGEQHLLQTPPKNILVAANDGAKYFLNTNACSNDTQMSHQHYILGLTAIISQTRIIQHRRCTNLVCAKFQFLPQARTTQQERRGYIRTPSLCHFLIRL